MSIVFLSIFCIIPSAWSAQHIYLQVSKSLLSHRASLHDEWSALDKDTVMTSYFRTMENATQEEKEKELHQILAMRGGNKIYAKQRKKIAALVYMGTNLVEVQRNQYYLGLKLLPDVTRKQDLPLITLLLEHGADIDQKDNCGIPAIFYAQKVAIAQLLIDYGAFNNLEPQQKQILLANVMRDSREADLITLYKKHGCNDLMGCDEFNWTPLMRLATWPQKQMIKKAKLLLKDLYPEQITHLLRAKNEHNQTVFHTIEAIKKISPPEKKRSLTAYYDYLVKKLIGNEPCSICLEPLKQNLILTDCTHIFHQACLSQCNKRECPLCRSNL